MSRFLSVFDHFEFFLRLGKQLFKELALYIHVTYFYIYLSKYILSSNGCALYSSLLYTRESYRLQSSNENCIKQLPLSNSAVPSHSRLNFTSICVYIYCIYARSQCLYNGGSETSRCTIKFDGVVIFFRHIIRKRLI